MRYILTICICSLVLASCKKKKDDAETVADPDTLTVNVQPVFGAAPLVLDQTYALNDSTDIQFTDIKFFMSNASSGGTVKKDYALFDYRNTSSLLFTIPGVSSDFTELNALIGVPASVNHSDPAAFPAASALNISNADDMHWAWSFGYIFIKVEARADTIPDGIPLFDHTLTYHVGSDAFSGAVSFPDLNWTAASTHHSVSTLHLNMEQFINRAASPINIRTEVITHSNAGQEALTAKVLSNFIAALTAP